MSPRPTSSSFVVMWSSHRIRSARISGWAGKPLPYLFGGPHISHPSPVKAGVSQGDSIFPLAFKKGQLMVLCECVVDEVIPIDQFCERFGVPKLLSSQSQYLRDWLDPRSCAWLAPTCTDDAVLLKSCTPLAFDRFVPLDQMSGIRMLNRRGERPLTNLLPDGRLKDTGTLHGRYYKASPATADLLARAARSEPPESADASSLWPPGRVT
jgi:hypothetical protein